jgi:glutathione-specific gamma-glutamylcyclotransferase
LGDEDLMSDLWVFGYGSLMWRPGFEFEEQAPARLHGWHRSLCIYSTVYRGTPEAPGLVLGLERGGSCLGIVFRVNSARHDETMEYLRERELITNVYREILRPVRLVDGSDRTVSAVTYVVNPGHPQVAESLAYEHRLAMVARGIGKTGSNRDYVRWTHDVLSELGVRDRRLAKFVKDLDRFDS